MKTRRFPISFLLIGISFMTCMGDTAAAAPFAYITSSTTNVVTVIDTANNTIVGTISMGHPQRGVAVSSDGTRVYVTMGEFGVPGLLGIIDTTTIPNTVSTVQVGIAPIGVAVNPAGTRVYVGNNDQGAGNTVSVIDTTTNPPSVIGMIVVGYGPGGMAFNPSGTRLYVVNNPESSLTVIDVTQNPPAALTTVSLLGSNGLCGVAVDPSGSLVYVAGSDSQLVHVFDASTNTVVAEISVAGNPVGVALNPTGTKLYVTQPHGANTVTVIDTISRSVLRWAIPVGIEPVGVAVNSSGTRVFVANLLSGTVSVLDTANDYVIDTISVGGGPESFGRFIGLGGGISFQSTLDDINHSFEIGQIDNLGLRNSLVQKIKAAQAAAARGQEQSKANILNALMKEVKAQRGKHIAEAAAQVILQDVESLLNFR